LAIARLPTVGRTDELLHGAVHLRDPEATAWSKTPSLSRIKRLSGIARKTSDTEMGLART
jgi:hypothetical protein